MNVEKIMADELFIIGNGFDLQCGLGTTYENFLKYTFSRLENEEKAEIVDAETFDLDDFLIGSQNLCYIVNCMRNTGLIYHP